MSQPRVTLDQWSALVAVVESGGYAQASERLHRSQSTVTYTIKKLEESLGVSVLELRGRKAHLTPTGELLYRRGKSLVEEAARVERAAADLECDHERQQRCGHAHRLHVSLSGGIAADLAEASDQEQRSEQDAAEQFDEVLGGVHRGNPPVSGCLRDGILHLLIGSKSE